MRKRKMRKKLIETPTKEPAKKRSTKKAVKEEPTKDELKAKLIELIPSYGEHNATVNATKKIADNENKQIKSIMQTIEIDSLSSNGYVATLEMRESKDFDEAKIMELALANKKVFKDIIKTKQYLDMDALESAIYNKTIPAKILTALNLCEIAKKTPVLHVKKEKISSGADSDE